MMRGIRMGERETGSILEEGRQTVSWFNTVSNFVKEGP